MEEVLRRQRRKKKFFYDHQQTKFGVFWNRNVDKLSKAKYLFGEGVPGHKKNGINLMTLKQKGKDINEILRECINEIWD
jgi:hypothetical protein